MMSNRELVIGFQKIPDLTIVLQSEYRILAHSVNNSMVYHLWLPDAPEMDEDIFKEEVLEVINQIKIIRPSFFLANDKFREIRITEELNEFLLVNFFPIYGHPTVKKVGMIRSSSLSFQSELETAMEELSSTVSESDRTFRFFDDVEPAIEWLGTDKVD